MDVLYSNKESIIDRIERLIEELKDIKKELAACDIIEEIKMTNDDSNFIKDDVSDKKPAKAPAKTTPSEAIIKDTYDDYDSISGMPSIEL